MRMLVSIFCVLYPVFICIAQNSSLIADLLTSLLLILETAKLVPGTQLLTLLLDQLLLCCSLCLNLGRSIWVAVATPLLSHLKYFHTICGPQIELKQD